MCNFKWVKFSLGEYQQNTYEKISGRNICPCYFRSTFKNIWIKHFLALCHIVYSIIYLCIYMHIYMIYLSSIQTNERLAMSYKCPTLN